MTKTIAFGCDHAGFDFKERIITELRNLGYEVLDCGTNSTASVDYPDHAAAVAKAVVNKQAEKGIIVCGSGVGVSIVANKFDGIRAALCHDHMTAELCRKHNDANIVTFGTRIIGIEVALDIIRTFLATEFEGGRHCRRIEKISAIEADRNKE